MRTLKGIVVPMITPFTEDDHVDKESLEKLCDYCIETGADALYPCGTTGEMALMRTEERKETAEIVVKHTNKRIPVYIHVGCMSEWETIELLQHAEKIGADGAAIVTPWYHGYTDDQLVRYFVRCAKAVSPDFPIYLYGIPGCAKNDISEYVARECSKQAPNIVGIKYSVPDMNRYIGFIGIDNSTGKFSLLAGSDSLYAAAVTAGGDGVVSGNAMVIPAYYTAIREALKKKEYEKAAKIQAHTNLLIDAICCVNNTAAYKVFLKEKGIIACANTRAPMEGLTADQIDTMWKKLNELDYTMSHTTF